VWAIKQYNPTPPPRTSSASYAAAVQCELLRLAGACWCTGTCGRIARQTLLLAIHAPSPHSCVTGATADPQAPSQTTRSVLIAAAASLRTTRCRRARLMAQHVTATAACELAQIGDFKLSDRIKDINWYHESNQPTPAPPRAPPPAASASQPRCRLRASRSPPTTARWSRREC